jgi:hypothetical protein
MKDSRSGLQLRGLFLLLFLLLDHRIDTACEHLSRLLVGFTRRHESHCRIRTDGHQLLLVFEVVAPPPELRPIRLHKEVKTVTIGEPVVLLLWLGVADLRVC